MCLILDDNRLFAVSRITSSVDHMKNASCGAATSISKTTAPSSGCPQPFPKHHLSIASVPTVPHCLSAVPRVSSKPGVASLLFHRTLSPSDALQVHSYAAKSMLHKSQHPCTVKPREDLREPDIKPDAMPDSHVPEPNTVEVGYFIHVVC